MLSCDGAVCLTKLTVLKELEKQCPPELFSAGPTPHIRAYRANDRFDWRPYRIKIQGISLTFRRGASGHCNDNICYSLLHHSQACHLSVS